MSIMVIQPARFAAAADGQVSAIKTGMIARNNIDRVSAVKTGMIARNNIDRVSVIKTGMIVRLI